MEETKNMTCIVCPVGCGLSVKFEDGKVVNVEGFNCKRGREYALAETTNPTRVLTTTVRINGARLPVIPVKSDRPIPKGKLFECMKVINDMELNAPVSIGDVVIRNILVTGANIIATRNL